MLLNRVSGQKETYFNEALAQWDWFCQSDMINERNLINDSLTDDCANNGRTEWSYNQGQTLGALVELDAASRYDYYIDTAHSIAKAAILGLTDSDGILYDPCEPNCGADAS
jgi:predicted alpha-1,6-mannanase (GH76 family)